MTDTNKPAEIPPATLSPVKAQTPAAMPANATPPAKPADSTPPAMPANATPPAKPANATPPAKPPTIEGKPADAKPMAPPPIPPQSARPVPPPPPKPPIEAPSAKLIPPPRRTGTPIWATAAAFVLLAGGLYWVWHDRSQGPSPAMLTLQDDLSAAKQRIATLEQRPAPAPAPAPDTARIAALEKAVKAMGNNSTDTTGLEQRLASLEARPVPVMPDVSRDVQTAIAGANAELSAKIASLDNKVQQDLARATRLRAATAAMDAGKPLGDLPGAPAAVQRYATTAPPTEPELRQSFAGFAAAAEKASQPTGEGKDFAARMWGRAQQLVTIRQGDKVLVGAPAAVTLAAARTKLDAGDLAGAVAALTPLDPPATAAMAPWKRDAQSLLDARAGLAALATKS